MKKFNWLALIAVATMMSAGAQAQTDRFSDFTLTDQEGNGHQISKYGYQNAMVIISQANGCEMNERQMTAYKLLRSKWEHQGVGLLLINSQPDVARDDVRATEAVYNYDIPIMLDYGQLVATELGITRAGQVVVVDPTLRTILFRGPLDVPREEELQGVLQRIVDGEDTRNMETVEVDFEIEAGCELDLSVPQQFAQTPPDYETEIAPILIERCVGCHVEGGIGPFAMNSHQMVQGWSPMMKEVIMTRRMPPMQVDPDVGSWPINSYNLPVEEKQKLISWFNAGSPRE